MTKDKALRMALEALEESLGYVEEEAENAQRLYGQYPTRQARIQGLKDDARKHMDAITAIREALAEQETVLPGGGHVPAIPVAVYGYCPECGGAGVMRERRPNGDDKCTNGHKYPSLKALAEQPAQKTCLVANESCKHGSWCSESYCQEHFKFVELPAQQQELEELTAQRDQLADILTRTANALKGQPEELSCHSWHDLPEVAKQLKAAQRHEPVGWIVEFDDGHVETTTRPVSDWKRGMWESAGKRFTVKPLYTSPPARKPLMSQERDAQRWRFLMENSYDSESVTQFHVWEHSWEPHSKTGEPTEWKQRVRGIALVDFIDRAVEAAHGITGENK